MERSTWGQRGTSAKLCMFDFQRAISVKLVRKGGDATLREQIYSRIRCAEFTIDVHVVDGLFYSLWNDVHRCATSFIDYFISQWAPKVRKWSIAYRNHTNAGMVTTNSAIERYHQLLKPSILGGRRVDHRRIDWLLYTLLTVGASYLSMRQCKKQHQQLVRYRIGHYAALQRSYGVNRHAAAFAFLHDIPYPPSFNGT